MTVNEQLVFNEPQSAGRPYAPDADVVRFPIARGRNRILVLSRQGIGPQAFGVQVARSPTIGERGGCRSLAGRGHPAPVRDAERRRCWFSRRGPLLRSPRSRLRSMPLGGRPGPGHDRPRPHGPGSQVRPRRADPIRPRALQPDRRRVSSGRRCHTRRPRRLRHCPLRDRRRHRAGRRRGEDHPHPEARHRRPLQARQWPPSCRPAPPSRCHRTNSPTSSATWRAFGNRVRRRRRAELSRTTQHGEIMRPRQGPPDTEKARKTPVAARFRDSRDHLIPGEMVQGLPRNLEPEVFLISLLSHSGIYNPSPSRRPLRVRRAEPRRSGRPGVTGSWSGRGSRSSFRSG